MNSLHYTPIIKVILVAYILMTPFLNNAPITRLAKEIVFACLYIAGAIALAVFYDITVAVLLMVVLVIWLSCHVVRPADAFTEKKGTHEYVRPSERFEAVEAIKDVKAIEAVEGAFRLPAADDTPLSANAYEPSLYGAAL